MKIYTKTGDGGTSMTTVSGRVSKSDLVFEALGTLDELDSFLGQAIAEIENTSLCSELEDIQKLLYKLMAAIHAGKTEVDFDTATKNLESLIDFHTQKLGKLNNFIMPGGNRASSTTHVVRAVCRRAERTLVAYIESCQPNTKAQLFVLLAFVNRLSDYFFTISRSLSQVDKESRA